MVSIYAYLSTYVKNIWGETTREEMVLGAKRLGLKIEAKRLGGKRPGRKRLGGETSCYPLNNLFQYFKKVNAGPEQAGFLGRKANGLFF